MIRFYVRRTARFDPDTPQETEILEFDVEAPDLEVFISGGGHGPMGTFDHREILYAKVIKEPS